MKIQRSSWLLHLCNRQSQAWKAGLYQPNPVNCTSCQQTGDWLVLSCTNRTTTGVRGICDELKCFELIRIRRRADWRAHHDRFVHGYWWHSATDRFGYLSNDRDRARTNGQPRKVRLKEYKPLPWAHNRPYFSSRGQWCKQDICCKIATQQPETQWTKCQHTILLYHSALVEQVQATRVKWQSRESYKTEEM